MKLRQQAEKERDELIATGASAEDLEERQMPSIPYWRCRQIMTRTDFLEGSFWNVRACVLQLR